MEDCIFPQEGAIDQLMKFPNFYEHISRGFSPILVQRSLSEAHNRVREYDTCDDRRLRSASPTNGICRGRGRAAEDVMPAGRQSFAYRTTEVLCSERHQE